MDEAIKKLSKKVGYELLEEERRMKAAALRSLSYARSSIEQKKYKEADKLIRDAANALMPRYDGSWPKLINKWGHKDCCAKENSPIFKDDAECYCGCVKHHYHCTTCGMITQIG